MTSTARVNVSYRIGGRVVDAVISKTDEAVESQQIPLPAGIAGELTTRTSASVGVITVESGHGLTTSDTLGVFFDDGIRYGVTITGTTATTITIATGAGTDLPLVNSDVIIGKEVTSAMALSGANVKILFMHSPYRCAGVVLDGSAAVVVAQDIAAGESWAYIEDFGGANPFSGSTLASVVGSNGSVTATTFDVGLLKSTV